MTDGDKQANSHHTILLHTPYCCVVVVVLFPSWCPCHIILVTSFGHIMPSLSHYSTMWQLSCWAHWQVRESAGWWMVHQKSPGPLIGRRHAKGGVKQAFYHPVPSLLSHPHCCAIVVMTSLSWHPYHIIIATPSSPVTIEPLSFLTGWGVRQIVGSSLKGPLGSLVG